MSRIKLPPVGPITAQEAFFLKTSCGLSEIRLTRMGYTWDAEAFAKLMEEHRAISRKGIGMFR